jgi:hypothetical protein
MEGLERPGTMEFGFCFTSPRSPRQTSLAEPLFPAAMRKWIKCNRQVPISNFIAGPAGKLRNFTATRKGHEQHRATVRRPARRATIDRLCDRYEGALLDAFTGRSSSFFDVCL